LPGAFIALEGIDGSGKSTIAERLVAALRQAGMRAILTREPGGTAIGEQIRVVLLGHASSSMLPATEMLLFAAARAQHVGEVIRPALAQGFIVVTDRFTDSSLAYQWGARGLPKRDVILTQELATDGLEPDLKVLLDLPVDVALRRRMSNSNDVNRLDREEIQFHTRVRDAYHSLAAADPARWRVVNADRAEDDVWADVWHTVVSHGLLRSGVGTIAHWEDDKEIAVRLILAVIQSGDAEALLSDLAAIGASATQIEGDTAVGSAGLAALVVGVEDNQVSDVLTLVRTRARGRARRIEPLRPIAGQAEFWIPGPAEQSAGGASVFVLPVRQFERIGYA
jgi:dTMP kinase